MYLVLRAKSKAAQYTRQRSNVVCLTMFHVLAGHLGYGRKAFNFPGMRGRAPRHKNQPHTAPAEATDAQQPENLVPFRSLSLQTRALSLRISHPRLCSAKGNNYSQRQSTRLPSWDASLFLRQQEKIPTAQLGLKLHTAQADSKLMDQIFFQESERLAPLSSSPNEFNGGYLSHLRRASSAMHGHSHTFTTKNISQILGGVSTTTLDFQISGGISVVWYMNPAHSPTGQAGS